MGIAWGAGPGVVDLPAMAAIMRPVLEQWMSAQVRIYDVNREQAPSSHYNPLTDAGGTVPRTLIYDSGENGAIVQPVRSPTRIEAGIQPNAIIGIKFQLKREPDPTVTLRGGMTAQVVAAGEATGLTSLTFSLLEGMDASITWHRIIDAAVLTGGQ